MVPRHPPRAPADPPPATVWTALAADHQERVVRLLAHLACTLAHAQATRPKEVVDADAAGHP